MSTPSEMSPQHRAFLDEQIRMRDQMSGMSLAERAVRCARVLFRAQTERAPTAAELATFINSGDYHRAMEDPVTFERLEGAATKAGQLEQAQRWAAVGRLASGAHFDEIVAFAVLQTILIQERNN